MTTAAAASAHEGERAALLARLRTAAAGAAHTAAQHAPGTPLTDSDAGAADLAEALAALLVHGVRAGAVPRLLCALRAADSTAPVDSAELWARHALNRRAVPAALARLAAGADALAPLYEPWAADTLAATAADAQAAWAPAAHVGFALTMTGRASSVVTVDFKKRRRRRRRVACAVIDAGEGEVPEGEGAEHDALEDPGAAAAAALAALGAADGEGAGEGAAPPFPLPLVVPDAVATCVAEDSSSTAASKVVEVDEVSVPDAPDATVGEAATSIPSEPEGVPQVDSEPAQEQVATEVEPEAAVTVSSTDVQEQQPQHEDESVPEDSEDDGDISKEVEHESSTAEEEKEDEKEEEDDKVPDATTATSATTAVPLEMHEVEAVSAPAAPVEVQKDEATKDNSREDFTEKEMEARAEMMQRVVRTFVGGSLVIADYDQDDTKRTISQIVEARLRAAAESAGDSEEDGAHEHTDTDSGSRERDVAASREPPASWTPLVTEVHFYVPHGGTVADQHGECYACRGAISAGRAALNRGRYCHYTGRFFCRRCFGQGWRSAILGRVVHDWDFRELPVNRQSAEFLRAVAAEPVIDVAALNPRLYAAVPLLQDVRLVRRRACHLRDYIACCPRLAPDDECRALLQRLPSHHYTTTEMYSLDDLRSLSAVLARLLAAVQVWVAHVTACELCTQKGFYCELCHSDTLIYPYQVHDVVQCPQCNGVFHRACFAATSVCPKCLRMVARQLSSSHDPTTTLPS